MVSSNIESKPENSELKIQNSASNKRPLWNIVRYPLGSLLIGLYFYLATLAPTIPYKNIAQEGGDLILRIFIFWLLFYIFLARKNGVILNLIAPAFGFGAMVLTFNLSKGCLSGPPC